MDFSKRDGVLMHAGAGGGIDNSVLKALTQRFFNFVRAASTCTSASDAQNTNTALLMILSDMVSNAHGATHDCP